MGTEGEGRGWEGHVEIRPHSKSLDPPLVVLDFSEICEELRVIFKTNKHTGLSSQWPHYDYLGYNNWWRAAAHLAWSCLDSSVG